MNFLDTAAYLVSAFVIGGAVLLIAFAAFGTPQAKNMFRAGDKLVATFFDFDGSATLSAECGYLAETGGHIWPSRVIDAIFGKGHCEKAAQREGLI